MSEKLREWRKAHEELKKEQNVQSISDCQKLAEILTEKALKQPFNPNFYRVNTMIDISKSTAGDCLYGDFLPIMQDKCQKVFGEKCKIVRSEGRMGIEFEISHKYF